MIESNQPTKSHLDAVIASAIDAIVVANAQGVIEMFNAAAEQMFGYRSEEIIGHNINLLMPDSDSSSHQLYIQRYIETGQSRIPRKGREVIAKRRNGETFFADIAISDVELDGNLIFTAIIRDITERKNREQRIIQLAYFDQETGLPNSYYLDEKLEDLLKEPTNENYLISLYIGDLTEYVNIFGTHVIKDIILTLANQLTSQLPPRSLIVRSGVHLLKIICPAASDYLTTEACAKNIQSYLSQPVNVAGERIFLNSKFGLTKINPEEQNLKTLLSHAEIALHLAKNSIIQSYEIYSSELYKTLHRRAQIVQKLHQVIHEPPFELYLQPQISLVTHDIIGVEALIRWQDSDGTWIPPAEFIPISETIGLIKDITFWTLKKACSIIKDWKTSNNQQYRCSVNISAQVLCSPGFVDDMRTLLEETDINPQTIELEITETALMQNFNIAVKTVAESSDLGVTIAIDDFGTGWSSLAYLKLFKINRIKIDRSFIIDIMESKNDRTMVEAIIKLCHELGFQVVCEGVENMEQLKLLETLGCDEVQGYFFAKPMPVDQFQTWAKNFKIN